MNVFYITYNPKSEIESNTAVRLQTLSNLYGIKTLLPYRTNTGFNKHEDKIRISQCDIIIAFSLEKLSKELTNELEEAINQNKRIIIIYDKSTGKNINFKSYNNLKEIYVDFNDTDKALNDISSFIKSQPGRKTQKRKKENALGLAFMGVGLGLLALWALNKSE